MIEPKKSLLSKATSFSSYIFKLNPLFIGLNVYGLRKAFKILIVTDTDDSISVVNIDANFPYTPFNVKAQDLYTFCR